MQYIGDAKSGRFVGSDQYVFKLLKRNGSRAERSILFRFNNRYYENMNAEEEIPGTFTRFLAAKSLILSISVPLGRQRWVDFSQV